MTYQLPKTFQDTATVWNELTVSSSKPGLTATLVHAKKGEAVELPNKQTVLTESVSVLTSSGAIVRTSMTSQSTPVPVTFGKA